LDTNKKPVDNKQLFYKLVRLHRWDEQRRETLAAGVGELEAGALRVVKLLAADREGFARVMSEAEEWLKSRGEKKSEAAPETPEQVRRLYALLEGSRRLREILAAAPPFSEADPRAVETLARFADVTPDGQSMLNTQDAVFMGVLEAAQGPDLAGLLPIEELHTATINILTEHLGKALAVQKADKAAAERLTLLPHRHWPAVLASLEDGRDYTDGAESEAGRLLRALQPEVSPELQAGFGRPPRLSQLEPLLYRLVWEKRDDLRAALALLPESALGAAQAPSLRPCGTEARRILLADEWVGKEHADDFEYGLRLRFELARHLVEVRKTAKVETLIYKWPQAARLALANRSSIVNVESYLLRQTVAEAPPGTTEEERELYKLSQEDELFARLLRTQPYFSGIALFQYLSAAPLPPVTRPTTAPTTATTKTAPPDDTKAVPTDAQRGLPTERGGRGSAPPAAQRPTDDYDTYVFTVAPFAPTNDPEVFEWQTEIYHDGGIINPPGNPKVSSKQLSREVYEAAVGKLSEGGDPQPLLSRMFSRTDREYLFRVVTAGKVIFKTFFGTFTERFRSVRQASGADGNMRVAVACDLDFWHLPWEWLTFPGEETNFVLSEKHSLVRFLPSPLPSKERPEPDFVQRLTPPLRVLIVMPATSFDPAALGEADGRALSLEESLMQQGVLVRRLSGMGVTAENLRAAILDHSPHVLHYEGGVESVTTNNVYQPCLLLSGSTLLPLGELKEELKTAGLQLLLIKNSPNVVYRSESVRELLEGLVGEVVPAAIAPVRSMDDAPAGEFLRSFYRALGDGKRLEAAVARARLELLSKGGDWSAYALFAHLKTLESSRLLPPPAPPS
jgi:hypothetical protein